jgi:hypothetical protein
MPGKAERCRIPLRQHRHTSTTDELHLHTVMAVIACALHKEIDHAAIDPVRIRVSGVGRWKTVFQHAAASVRSSSANPQVQIYLLGRESTYNRRKETGDLKQT